MSPPVIVLMLTLMLGIQPITTDLYLPALPTLARTFAAPPGTVQLTLSALIICFGFGQLVAGPVADRFGRRPVLLAGLAAYTAASVASAAAPSIGWLIGWRALQGAAMACAVTCGRSVVRDLFQPHDGAKVMARALSGLGVIALLSPVLGGVLVQWLDWHAALLALAVFGAGSLAFVALRYVETVPARNPQALAPAQLWRNWRVVAANPTFRAYALLSSLTYGGLFLYLAGSSFAFIDALGTSRVAYGAILMTNSVAYLAGTVICRRLLASHGLVRTVRIGGALSLAGGLLVALFPLLGIESVPTVMAPLWLYAVGHGIHQPCGQAGAVGPFPDKAGTAAALSGFLMTVAAFAAGLWLGHAVHGSVRGLVLGIAACGVGVATVAWTLVQRHGEPGPAARAA